MVNPPYPATQTIKLKIAHGKSATYPKVLCIRPCESMIDNHLQGHGQIIFFWRDHVAVLCTESGGFVCVCRRCTVLPVDTDP